MTDLGGSGGVDRHATVTQERETGTLDAIGSEAACSGLGKGTLEQTVQRGRNVDADRRFRRVMDVEHHDAFRVRGALADDC